MKIVHSWLGELVDIPSDVEVVAREISLRGFEVASVERGVIDFEITANRPDCLSHLGIAREASAIFEQPLRLPELTALAAGPASGLDVSIDDAELCPRYCAQVFEVTIGPSPPWLTARLEAAGVRPISNIVDITNYVMLELGQPLHAFDLERLEGGRLVIRRARPSERLRTLDGVDRQMTPDMLVIADAARASAIGGVMGGADSEIGPGTTLIALESAYFQPASVRRTSKQLGLKTEASIRFERGADVATPPLGIARAAALMQKLKAGRPVGGLIDRFPAPPPSRTVRLRESRVSRLLGVTIPGQDVPGYLTPLGFAAERAAPDEWLVTVPSCRVDVTRETDLIEEVGRHYGFDRIPTTFPVLDKPQAPPDERIERDRRIKSALCAAGLSESMTFAFIERSAALPFCEPATEPAALANPLSEKFAVLRPSLLPGLVDACAHNRRRGRKDVRLFETGSRFTSRGEGRGVAFTWAGDGSASHWSAASRNVDLFDVKGLAELICQAVDVAAPDFTESGSPVLVRGRAAAVVASGRTIGFVGQLDPSIAEARGLPAGEEVYVGELDVDALAELADRRELKAQTPPRYPSIVRDLSILVPEALPAAAVRGTIRSAAPSTLESIGEFDRYQGKGVPEGRVSLSLRLTFRSSERTLTDQEVDAAMKSIVDALKSRHEAERR